MNQDLQQLRVKCPLPVLMGMVDLGKYAKRSCPSPFRPDQHASWGIFQTNGRWLYKDFATDECGDEIAFLAQVYKADEKDHFLHLLDLYTNLAKGAVVKPVAVPVSAGLEIKSKPDVSFLNPGTHEQMVQLAALRKISIEGLNHASQRVFIWASFVHKQDLRVTG